VAGAIRELTHGGAQGGLTVGDDTSDVSVGGIGSGLNLPPSPGRQASSLELLSDPKGVDFRPYLLQVLASRPPELVRGLSGERQVGPARKVEAQFVIAKDGSVPKLVIVLHSIPALERAAVAGIDASHPFPPFPQILIGVALAAAGWGATAIVLYPKNHLTNQLVLAFVLGGMMVGAASVLAARVPAFAVFIVLCGLPTSLRLLFETDDVHVAMGRLAVLYTITTLITAWRVHLTIVSSLRLRFENQDLLTSLQKSEKTSGACAVWRGPGSLGPGYPNRRGVLGPAVGRHARIRPGGARTRAPNLGAVDSYG
jgi:hypothetical protein